LFLLASMLVVLGLPGMYVRQAGRTGLLGLIGFVLTVLLWLILGVGGQTIDAFVLPWLVGNVATRPLLDAGAPWEVFFVVGPVLALVGPLLLGLVTMRAGVLPRGAGLLLFVSSLLDGTAYVPLPSPIGTLIESAGLVLLCLGLAWLGYALLSLQGPEVEQSRLAATEASR